MGVYSSVLNGQVVPMVLDLNFPTKTSIMFFLYLSGVLIPFFFLNFIYFKSVVDLLFLLIDLFPLV